MVSKKNGGKFSAGTESSKAEAEGGGECNLKQIAMKKNGA